MPGSRVVFYRREDGCVPVLEWLDSLPSLVKVKWWVRFERLKQLGHEIRRPEADILREGIHELRVRYRRTNYRVLYFHHGQETVVLTHGLTKEKKVSGREISRALRFKTRFEANPTTHTHVESEHDLEA